MLLNYAWQTNQNENRTEPNGKNNVFAVVKLTIKLYILLSDSHMISVLTSWRLFCLQKEENKNNNINTTLTAHIVNDKPLARDKEQ